MRVALVVHDLDPGYGQGRYCIELLRRLASRVEFTVFANSVRDGVLPPGVSFCRVPAWRARSLTTVLSFIGPAEWALRGWGDGLVHAQGLSCWRADVITAHVCSAARLRGLPASQHGLRRFLTLVSPVERRFYRQRRARHLIAISQVVAGEIREAYGWNRPVSIIHHGTDLDLFRPARDAAEVARLRAGFGVPVGAWLWLFIGEAAKGLSGVVGELAHFPDAHLLVVSRSELGGYREQAARLGVADRVVFHGPTGAPQEVYRACDALVYPAGYDAFAMVGAEAMASGLPVVLSRRIGVAELITTGVDGLLFDEGGRDDLRGQLKRLAAMPDRGRSLGTAARRTMEHHTWERCAEETFKIYEEQDRSMREARR